MNHLKFNTIIIVLLCQYYSSQSQPWYFNNLYNPNETWASGLSIIGTSDGYFGCAISGDSVSDYFYNTCIFLLDETGQVIVWKNFGQYGYDYYPGYYGSLVQTQDSGYALFGSRHNLSNNLSDGLFFKFNSNGDTIFSRIFNSDVYNNFVGRTCTSIVNGGFALLGEVSNYSGYSDVVLIKTDYQANELWRSQQGTDIDDWGVSIAQTKDLGYILGTWAYIPGLLTTADPIVIKTDSLGEYEWSLNLGGPYGDDKAMVCNTNDSCIIVLTAYADSMYTPEYAYTRINLVKIDLAGNVIWNKKFGSSKPVNFISNIQITQNGGFILCGYSMILDPSFVNAGWIMEVNSGGDSLWYKDYYYYPPGSSYPYNEMYDISITEDHGFIAVGQAYTLDPPNDVQKMWVLKVDSIGCEIPNCWVGIPEPGGGEAGELGGGEAGKQGGMVVWPNPASGVLSVKCLGLNEGVGYEFRIYDVFGRPASILTLPPVGGEGDEWKIDISSLPPGLYFVSVLENGNRVAGGKFVVAR